MTAQFVLDALEHAIWQRKTPDNKDLIHHSDRGSQYLSIKCDPSGWRRPTSIPRSGRSAIPTTMRLPNASSFRALTRRHWRHGRPQIFKTEVINQLGPWKSVRDVEWETLKWVDWYNNRRLIGPIGYITPAEAEEAFYANLNVLDMVD